MRWHSKCRSDSTGASSYVRKCLGGVDNTYFPADDPFNHARVLDASSGQKALLIFSEITSGITAFLLDKGGAFKTVNDENLPKDFSKIKTLDSFNAFLDNSYARSVELSDGETKLYVQQKGLGGSEKCEKTCWSGSGSAGGKSVEGKVCVEKCTSEKGGSSKSASGPGGSPNKAHISKR